MQIDGKNLYQSPTPLSPAPSISGLSITNDASDSEIDKNDAKGVWIMGGINWCDSSLHNSVYWPVGDIIVQKKLLDPANTTNQTTKLNLSVLPFNMFNGKNQLSTNLENNKSYPQL